MTLLTLANLWPPFATVSAFTVPTVPGVEYRNKQDRLHYTYDGDRLHFRLNEE